MVEEFLDQLENTLELSVKEISNQLSELTLETTKAIVSNFDRAEIVAKLVSSLDQLTCVYERSLQIRQDVNSVDYEDDCDCEFQQCDNCK